MTSAAPVLKHENYTVGWICALASEMAAAKAMLDQRHASLQVKEHDSNTYQLGSIGSHNVVIACLPLGVTGTTSAATVAAQMLASFSSIRFGLMVGVGGGIPSETVDIRLGDVVVSKPLKEFGGVIQYRFGKTAEGGRFIRTSTLNKPPQVLLTAVNKLQADHMVDGNKLPDILARMEEMYPNMKLEFTHRGAENDRLFRADYDHVGRRPTCDLCDADNVVLRPIRHHPHPTIHYGLIASDNIVMRHGTSRDALAQELGIICVEMEAAGLIDSFPCLVIRGICDYADSHKNKMWQPYAAATAAAYARELLNVITGREVVGTQKAAEATQEGGE
jgi:nucleoside phosphorylase